MDMKKKWIALATTMVMITAMAIPAMADNDYESARLRPDYTIMIDGQEKHFKRADGSAAYPLVYEGSTYLPLRAIGEALGKNVNWDEKTKTVTLEGIRDAADSSNKAVEGKVEDVSVQVRKDFTIVIDGKEQTFRTSSGKEIYPLLYEGSTYLPLRAIGQIMDRTVEWDNDTKTVTLKSSGYTVTDADSFGDKTTVTDADSFQSTTGVKDKDKKDKDAKDIGLEKAKKTALQDAKLQEKDVIFVTAKADYDDGRKEYEIEFYYNGMEYDYEIDAETGKILEFDRDFEGKLPAVVTPAGGEISAAEAKNIALKHAGLKESDIRELEVEKDYDDGIPEYEVEFESGRMEYEYEIDARTGKILKAEKDYDD